MRLGKSGRSNLYCNDDMKKSTLKKRTGLGSEIIVDFLSQNGIKHVFDLSGGMIAFIEDAISRRAGIECVPMHHEQAAGFAAEGYARKSQNFGVAIATSGPGATNLITAIGSSYFDSIPTMFIVGQVHTDNIKKKEGIRQEGFQETDIVRVIKPLTKYAVLVTKVEDILYELEKSHYIMKTGRPGSVLIDIPINLQRNEAENFRSFYGSAEHLSMVRNEKEALKVDVRKVEKLRQMLTDSKAPLILAGNGVRLSSTTKELYSFAKRNNLPVVTSLLGIDCYPFNDNFAGYVGSNGNRHANIIFANADLIIVLGSRLDIRQTGDVKSFNKKAKVVHVDIDSNSLNYVIPTELSFEANLSDFFKATKNLTTTKKPAWVKFISSVKQYFSRPHSYKKGEIDANTFLHELSVATKESAVIVADVGQNQMWCAQSWVQKEGQRILFSGGMGAMGFSLPAAIGAWFADKSQEIIVICGDGGLQINIQELETVARNKIPMKLFIFNNKSLGMVREFQDLYFNKNHQSTVEGYGYPNFKKIAEAYGFKYEMISEIKEGDPFFKKTLKERSPLFVEVDIPITATLTPKIVYGHALDDQAPYLGDIQKKYLEELKIKLSRS